MGRRLAAVLRREPPLRSPHPPAGARVGGRPERTLPRKIGFINGLALLCLVSEVHRHCGLPLKALDLVRMMQTEAERRNSSVLAHGSRTLTEADSLAILQRAELLAAAILKEDGSAQLWALREALAPLPLDELAKAEV